jgi:MFS family permease
VALYIGGGITEEAVSETFYIAVAFFGFSSFIGGPLLERYGPRVVASTGVTFYMIGLCISALGCYLKQVPLLYVGYGIFGGIGIGATYICPIAGEFYLYFAIYNERGSAIVVF